LRDLIAEGDARSFYQVPSSKAKDKPGLSYVRGRRITVDFKEREVQTVTVVDSVAGLFLEAAPVDSVQKPKARPAPRRNAGRTAQPPAAARRRRQ
jgi:hypothetical protein